jgi:glycosyltransferase involved in cell wall biosynthesis
VKEVLVSILIPLFNSETYISETIQSAINQSWPNIEVIVVDDGSTDKSYAFAKSFDSKKVKVYYQENKGACTARNLAFEKSSGNYIQYLDADDLLAPGKIEQQIQLFEQYGNNIITSGKWGRFYEFKKDVKWEDIKINKDYSYPINWLLDSWIGGGMAQTSVWLTPRHLIEKVGPWNESLKINQDGEFFSRVLMQAEAIKFCPDAKVYYRSGNMGSVSQSNKSETKAASLLLSYRLYQENVKAHYNNINIRKALGNNYLNFMYQYQASFPALSAEAASYFKALDVGKMWPVGGKRFKALAGVIGFKNALKLKHLL